MLRVCVFTGSRADYGPLVALIRALVNDPDVDLRLLVSGGHLADDQGNTIDLIERDGFTADERVEIVLASDSPTGVAKSFGLGAIGYADALERINPDILVVLGDRYEALAVTIVAALRLLPVAHIGGGQVTAGSLDDPVRHAITQLAHLHFTANRQFRRRVIQLGQDPTRVHTVGALGLDTVLAANLPNRDELLTDLGLAATRKLFAVTYHPATSHPERSRAGLDGLLSALDRLRDATIVFTGTNVDGGGKVIASRIEQYVSRNAQRAILIPSMGHTRYLSLLKNADLVIGNSSSGLIEAPALRTPTVNIGTRQDGRPRSASVIDTDDDADDIESAIRQALTLSNESDVWSKPSPYGDGTAAQKIVCILKSPQRGRPTEHFFYDL